MDKQVIIDIREQALNQILNIYQASNDDLHYLGGFHNQVYSFKDKILRITERKARSINELKGEMAFVNYLKAKGIPVYQALELKKITTNNNIYYLTMFQKAEGKLWFQTALTNQHHYTCGKVLGKIHQASQNCDRRFRRPTFLKNRYLLNANIVLKNKAYKQYLKDLLKQINAIPKTKDNFGLIHGDYHFANLIYLNDCDIMVIDFDDCEYNYYLYDIAVYLFYHLLGADPLNINIDKNIIIFNNFMQGYLREMAIEQLMFNKLPLFFKLREIKLYLSLLHHDSQEASCWRQKYFQCCEAHFNNNLPFVDIDYNLLFNNLK